MPDGNSGSSGGLFRLDGAEIDVVGGGLPAQRGKRVCRSPPGRQLSGQRKQIDPVRCGDFAEDAAEPRRGEIGGDGVGPDRHVQVRMGAAEECRDPRPVAALGDQRKNELRRIVPIEADDDQRHGAVGAADMAIPVGDPFEPLIGGGGRAGLLQPAPQRLGRGEVVEHLRSREDGRRLRAIGGAPVRYGQNGEVHAGIESLSKWLTRGARELRK